MAEGFGIFLAEFMAAILSVAFLTLCGFLWKMQKSMSRLEFFIESTEEFKKDTRRRFDIHSKMLHEINSNYIENGKGYSKKAPIREN